jgi:hypothetical protein
MAGQVLHMVIVGSEDVPLYEADLSTKSTDAGGREVRAAPQPPAAPQQRCLLQTLACRVWLL